MSLSLYQSKRHDPSGLVVLQALNLLFAAGIVFLWALMSILVAGPMRWATGRGLGTHPELLDYPFVLLWLLPAVGACGARIAHKAEWGRLAYFLATYPLLNLGLVAGWYYLIPVHWH